MSSYTTKEARAIETLKARYFRTLDTKDWEGLQDVFTPDVEIDVTGEGMQLVTGAEAFVAMLREILGEATTVHHGHMPEIAVSGPGSNDAKGIWAMEDEIWWPEGSDVSHLKGAGHYHETYVRTDEGWRIASLRLTRLYRIVDLPDGTQLRT